MRFYNQFVMLVIAVVKGFSEYISTIVTVMLNPIYWLKLAYECVFVSSPISVLSVIVLGRRTDEQLMFVRRKEDTVGVRAVQ
jgi:hypothetical protein